MMKDTYPCDETEIPLTVNGVPIEYALRENGKPFYPKEVAAANKKSLEEKIQSKNVFATTRLKTDKELIKELVDAAEFALSVLSDEDSNGQIKLEAAGNLQSTIEKAKGVIND